MHRIVQDFANWIRDVLLLSKLTRIYLSDTANIQTTNSVELPDCEIYDDSNDDHE